MDEIQFVIQTCTLCLSTGGDHFQYTYTVSKILKFSNRISNCQIEKAFPIDLGNLRPITFGNRKCIENICMWFAESFCL